MVAGNMEHICIDVNFPRRVESQYVNNSGHTSELKSSMLYFVEPLILTSQNKLHIKISVIIVVSMTTTSHTISHTENIFISTK